MVSLIRAVDLPEEEEIKLEHPGPVPGGTFWALEGAHDLPYGCKIAEVPLGDLLSRGRLWLGNAEEPGEWTEIRFEADLPKFRVESWEDYDGCGQGVTVLPYVPEFYFVPHGWRGMLFVRRAEKRATDDYWTPPFWRTPEGRALAAKYDSWLQWVV
jgi:hypothetical protein